MSNYRVEDEDDYEYETFSWCNIFWAFVSTLFCPFFGFLATICGVLSFVDDRVKDDYSGTKKRCCSWVCIVLAFLLGCGFVALMLCSIFLTNNDIMNKINGYAVDPVVSPNLPHLSPVAQLTYTIVKVVRSSIILNSFNLTGMFST